MAVWLVRSDATWNKTMLVEFSDVESSVPKPVRLKIDRHLRKMPRIREGDDAVFARDGEGGLAFYGHARVRSVNGVGDVEEEEPGERRGRTPPGLVDFDSFAPFPKERPLSVFALTLTVVRKVNDPGRHFRLPIRRLDPRDLAVLISGEIYVARTAFYELYFALPSRVRDDFEQFALTKRLSLQSPHASDRRRFDLLAEYLQSELGPKLRLLVAAQHAYERIDCEGKPAFQTLSSEAAPGNTAGSYRRPIGRSSSAASRAVELEGTLELLAAETRAVDDRFEEKKWTPLL